MKKTIHSLSALLLAVCAVVMSSCSKYDDTELRNLIAANTSNIEQIQALISQGLLIKSVDPYTEGTGGIRITLSNGKTYDVSNGAAGKDAVVWTIGTDGYWYKDGTKTDYRAIGEKGDKGDTGATGAAGPQGEKGETGNYYRPGDDGYFYLCTATDPVGTKTNIKWQGQGSSSGVTATVDANHLLTLTNVQGTTEAVKIPLALLSSISLDMNEVGSINNGYPSFNFDTNLGTATVQYLLNPSQAYTGDIADGVTVKEDKIAVKSNVVTPKSTATDFFSITDATIVNGVLSVNYKVDGEHYNTVTTNRDMFAVVLKTDKGDVVSEYAIMDTPTEAWSISLPASTSVAMANTVTLTAVAVPAGTSVGTIAWTSSNTGVATVSDAGVVTPVAPGKATITASVTTTSGYEIKATCEVTVNAQGGNETYNTGTITIKK